MFSKESAKSLLKFGLPFQGNSFLAFFKDDLLIMYLGGVIGFKNLGYITFAKKYAEFSIRLITDNINRVAFPLFSRFQKEKQLLEKSLEKILFYETLLIFPVIIGVIFIFENLLKISPKYYLKWNNSLFSFYFFSLSAFFISLTTPFINLFNALGKVKISLYFMVLWTALTWILVPLSIKIFGYQGVSVAFFAMSLTFIFVYIKGKSFVGFSFKESIGKNLIATLAMMVYLILIRLFLIKTVNNYLYLSLSIIGAAVIYLLMIYKLKGKGLYFELKELAKR
jgi:PST family polysaccharide transporter/lipopolysaccharide exporter